MFTIEAHGVNPVTQDPAPLSYAQHRLLSDPAPVRICGAPTGSGKTYAFQIAAKAGKTVLFIVPTLALARDIQRDLRAQGIACGRWDGEQMQAARTVDGTTYGWAERLEDLSHCRSAEGGMIVATLEALANLTLDKARLQRTDLSVVDILQWVDHLVFDEAHTLNERAFGFLHFWLTLVAYQHQQELGGPRLTLLSATPSRLLEPLFEEGYLPPEAVARFDEEVTSGACARMLHGEVRVELCGSLLDTLMAEAGRLLASYQRVLVVYDSLRRLSGDETRQLASFLLECGVSPEEVLVIDGMDRQVARALGNSGFATGLVPEAHHRVIIGTSAVEMGVNLGVDAMISDAGMNPAACLQRMGRVARGNRSGEVLLTFHGDESPKHYRQLAALSGQVSVEAVRAAVEDDHSHQLRARRAQALGSAYWSMLSRRSPRLMAEISEIFREMAPDKVMPGGILDRVHQAFAGMKGRSRRAVEGWLKQIDEVLTDHRGFNSTVKLRFAGMAQDEVVVYDADWAQAHLESPVTVDDDLWTYDRPRHQCLRERREKIEVKFETPFGGGICAVNRFEEAVPHVVDFLRRKTQCANQPGYQEVLEFTQRTGLVVRK